MKETRACHCAECGSTTTHIVYRDRLLAAVQWCQRCFNVTVRHDERMPITNPIAMAALSAN